MLFLPELFEKLNTFVAEEGRRQEDMNAEAAMERVRQGDVDVNRLVHDWSTAFSQVSSNTSYETCLRW